MISWHHTGGFLDEARHLCGTQIAIMSRLCSSPSGNFLILPVMQPFAVSNNHLTRYHCCAGLRWENCSDTISYNDEAGTRQEI